MPRTALSTSSLHLCGARRRDPHRRDGERARRPARLAEHVPTLVMHRVEDENREMSRSFSSSRGSPISKPFVAPYRGKPAQETSARVRSGYVAAKSAHRGAPRKCPSAPPGPSRPHPSRHGCRPYAPPATGSLRRKPDRTCSFRADRRRSGERSSRVLGRSGRGAATPKRARRPSRTPARRRGRKGPTREPDTRC
jgi:hypothetical protein